MTHNTYQSIFTPGLFAGQVVIVTGGGSGIGRCTAHERARLGAHGVLVGRKPEKLQAVAGRNRGRRWRGFLARLLHPVL